MEINKYKGPYKINKTLNETTQIVKKNKNKVKYKYRK